MYDDPPNSTRLKQRLIDRYSWSGEPDADAGQTEETPGEDTDEELDAEESGCWSCYDCCQCLCCPIFGFDLCFRKVLDSVLLCRPSYLRKRSIVGKGMDPNFPVGSRHVTEYEACGPCCFCYAPCCLFHVDRGDVVSFTFPDKNAMSFETTTAGAETTPGERVVDELTEKFGQAHLDTWRKPTWRESCTWSCLYCRKFPLVRSLRKREQETRMKGIKDSASCHHLCCLSCCSPCLAKPVAFGLEKRVVAVAGDTVEIKHGFVYVNGEVEDTMPYANTTRKWKVSPPTCRREQMAKTTVPKGNVFVLGDNRGASLDSAVFGFIPRSSIYGRQYTGFWSCCA